MIWLFSILGALLFLFLLFCFLIAPGRRGKRTRGFFADQRYYAHRGLHGDGIPENSLAAFRAACEAGYGMELDVHRTADGKLCVFHDSALQRMCGVPGRIEEKTLAELQSLSLAGTGEHIPSFEKVLEAVGGRTPLIVEIKGETRDTEVCRLTAEYLDTYAGKYCVESFNPLYIAWWRKNRPEVVRGVLSCHHKGGKTLRSRFRAFVLTHYLLNVSARPDFLAHSISDRKNPAFRLARLLGGATVAWTCRSEKDKAACDGAFDVVIFEKIRPPQGTEKTNP